LCVALCFSFCRTNPFWFLHADFLSLLCCNSFAYFNKIEKDIVWSCIRVFFPLSCGRNPFECCLWFVSSKCLRDCWISSLSLSHMCPWWVQVGKGLSRDSKALKLALQHWLEAVSHLSIFSGLVPFSCKYVATVSCPSIQSSSEFFM
jgi:hypothetical protein